MRPKGTALRQPKEHTRVLSLIDDYVHPYAEFEIMLVLDPSKEGTNCYVIAIPRIRSTPTDHETN